METDCHALNDRFIKAPSYPPQLHHLRKALPLPQRARNDYRMALRPLGASKAVHRRAEEVCGSKKMGGSKNRMNADEIVRALRENAEWCDANKYEAPVCMGDNQRAAADLIERLQAQLSASQRREKAAVDALEAETARAEKAEAERDRAIKQMCRFCKSLDKKAGIKPVCAADCEWRGPQEAGKGKAE